MPHFRFTLLCSGSVRFNRRYCIICFSAFAGPLHTYRMTDVSRMGTIFFSHQRATLFILPVGRKWGSYPPSYWKKMGMGWFSLYTKTQRNGEMWMGWFSFYIFYSKEEVRMGWICALTREFLWILSGFNIKERAIMSLRRFVNLLMENSEKGVYSLRRLNLSRHPLFYSSTDRCQLSKICQR